MGKPFSMEWTIEEQDSNKILREFLADQKISKSALTDIKFKGGYLYVNETEVTVRYILKTGDRVTVVFPREEGSEQLRGEKISLSIVYEDRYVMVVEKPAGMSTIPSREHPSGSLANAIIGHYEQIGHLATVHIVTRLDRDTSGLVLIAKHRHIHHLLSLAKSIKTVERKYKAIISGVLIPSAGTVEEPIGRMDSSIIKREVREDGQYALTEYSTLQMFGEYSLVELKLHTGRTHQIRVHMTYIGHPLLGDDLYGGSRQMIERQALHCYSLEFLHPITGEELSFECALPEDMMRVIHSSKMLDKNYGY